MQTLGHFLSHCMPLLPCVSVERRMRWVRTMGGWGAIIITCGGMNKMGDGKTKVGHCGCMWGDKQDGWGWGRDEMRGRYCCHCVWRDRQEWVRTLRERERAWACCHIVTLSSLSHSHWVEVGMRWWVIVMICLLTSGIFLFSFHCQTHLLFGIFSYDWIHCLLLFNSLNVSLFEL